MALFKRQDREAIGTVGVVLALIAMMFGFFAFVVAARADNNTTSAPASGIQVALSEFAITPSSIAAPVHGTLAITNSGSAIHNLNVKGMVTLDAAVRVLSQVVERAGHELLHDG